MSDIILDIDRIVLSDLSLASDRAERIRALTQAELRHLLRDGLPRAQASGGEWSHLRAGEVHLGLLYSEGEVAAQLAQRIYRVLTELA